MTKRNKPNTEVETLRKRISNLSAAILRISDSLDIDTVRQEVVTSARVLTGARYGVIVTIDEAGRPQSHIASGFSEEDARQMAVWPDGRRLFAHLRGHLHGLDAPFRIADLGAYVRSLGMAPGLSPCGTFLGTPMRHRDLDAGNFFLGEKEGGPEFTDEDEEVLVLFATQAAIAIDNARAHHDERRARADLEALVETSPVGVVVFDAQTATPVCFNREARRIVETPGMPGRPAIELLEMLTSRLIDGREGTLDNLKRAETLRAAEIELPVPDGRNLRMLVNASPIRSQSGDVDSVVVTMQDLAPLEELDRLRAEFIGMVSHELRAPLTSIKGSTTTLLGTSRALDRAELRQFIRIIDMQADHMERLIGDLLDAGRIDAGTLSVDPEPRDVATLVEQARTTFQSSSSRAMRIALPPDLPQVMADERRIVQVLNNLFSNAARHSAESSLIDVSASCDGIEVSISVTDEGRGIPPEQLQYLFRKYADVAGRGREPAGFGLGLVICKGLVEAHGGRIQAESAGPGTGARFTFTLPVAELPGVVAAAGSSANSARQAGQLREPTPVLVVDDDPEILRYVRDILAGAGYTPLMTGDPEEVAALIRAKRPQLVLLDLILPGTDGVKLMETIPELADLPVIFISAYERDETVARALESGAADYIVKPFSPTELTARMRAVLRRRTDPEPFVLGDLSIDYDRRLVSLAGRAVSLTPIEYELLRVLSLNAGRAMTYASLLRQVWGSGDYGNTGPVRDFVKKIRRKLGDDGATPAYIANERGVGYRMPKPGEG